MAHGVTKGKHFPLPAEMVGGAIAALLRSDSLVVEVESTNELGWESTPNGSTGKPSENWKPDHTSTDRLFLPGPSMSNVSIVVDHSTTLA